MEPHPLFKSFIGAAEKQRDRRLSAIEEPLFSRSEFSRSEFSRAD